MDTKGNKPSARKQASKKAAAPGAKGKGAKRPKYDWEKIEREFRAGQLSIREIGAQYGPSDTAIRKRAKAEGWSRDLSDEVRQRTKAKLVRGEVRTESGGSQFSDEEIAEQAAERAVEVVQLHRRDIKAGRETVRTMLDELTSACVNQDVLEEVLQQQLDEEDASPQRRLAVERMMSLQGRAQTAQSLTNSLKTLITLERQAFNIDDQPKEQDSLDELLAAVSNSSRGIGGYEHGPDGE